MERHVKERLIGAAVLVAAAVILIPEMLSGPDREVERDALNSVAGNVPLKTYTIDLNRSPSPPVQAVDHISEQAPPPELSEPTATLPAPAAADAESSSPMVMSPDSAPEAPVQATRPEPSKVNEGPEPIATPRSAPVASVAGTVAPPQTSTAPATQPTKPATSSGWVVQLGSFSSRATAARLASQFKADGYDAFVMPVRSGGNTLYRVRLGPPVVDRDAATRVLNRVKGKVPGAAVVHHP